MKEVTPPQIPEDLNTAIKSGKVRAPTHIISTISDDRGTYFFYGLDLIGSWVFGFDNFKFFFMLICR